MVLLDQRVYKVYLDLLGARDQRVTLGHVVSLVPLAPLERQVPKEAKEDLDFLDQLDPMDFKVPKANPDNLVYLDLLAKMVYMVN